MEINIIKSFFMWCTIINGALLIIIALFCAFAGDLVYRLHGRMFPMPRETFNAAIYGLIGFFKLLVLCFNLVPYIALTIIARGSL